MWILRRLFLELSIIHKQTFFSILFYLSFYQLKEIVYLITVWTLKLGTYWIVTGPVIKSVHIGSYIFNDRELWCFNTAKNKRFHIVLFFICEGMWFFFQKLATMVHMVKDAKINVGIVVIRMNVTMLMDHV